MFLDIEAKIRPDATDHKASFRLRTASASKVASVITSCTVCWQTASREQPETRRVHDTTGQGLRKQAVCPCRDNISINNPHHCGICLTEEQALYPPRHRQAIGTSPHNERGLKGALTSLAVVRT